MEPASIRYKNPGAMWGRTGARPSAEREVATNNPLAMRWGSTSTFYLSDGLGQGNNIAAFPTFVQGICAQLDLWRTSKHYRNKRFADAIAIWSGGNEVASYINFVLARVPGMTPDTIMDDAFWRSSDGVAFLKAQAWHEAGKSYPAPEADWFEAQRRVLGGIAPEPETAPPTMQPSPDIDPSGGILPIPPVYPSPYPRPPSAPSSAPVPVKLPWYKRAWAKFSAFATSLFGGGFYFGGFQISAELILAVCLLLAILGIGAAVYFIGRHKNWWT